MADPAFRYEQKTAAQHAGDQSVPQLPDAGQVPRLSCATPPPSRWAACWCRIRNTARSRRPTPTVSSSTRRPFELRSPASVQQRLQRAGGVCVEPRTHPAVVRRSSPTTRCCRPTARKAGNGGRPITPVHRLTSAFTWQIPVGQGQAMVRLEHRASMRCSATGSTPRRAASIRAGRCSSTPATWCRGDPTLSNPTRDKWFDTSMFAVQDTFTPRSNPITTRG